jgi:hypothetical protein
VGKCPRLEVESDHDATDCRTGFVASPSRKFRSGIANPRTPVAHRERLCRFNDDALKRALTHSTRCMPKYSEQTQDKFELYVELISVDVTESKSDEGKRSVVSVVIEEFGLPNSYPVASMWYHKVIVMDKNSVGTVAKDLLDDMDARWCNYIKNSVGGCPREKL